MTNDQQPVRRGTLWFALLGAAGAWTVHLLAAYGVAEFGCFAGLGQRSMLGVNAVAWSILLMTIPVAATAVAAVLIARRIERRLRPLDDSSIPPTGTPAADRTATDRFLARTGYYAGVLFLLVILAQTLPILFFLDDC